MKYKDYDLPDELAYNNDSSWVHIQGDTATLGVIEPIAKALKEFLFIKLPEKKQIQAQEIYVSLETLKWSGHLTCPVSGKIVQVNEALYDEPGKINEDPYGSWIVKIKMESQEDQKNLKTAKQIVPWLDATLKGGK